MTTTTTTTLPNFDAATFQSGAPIDNPYFPLKPGTIFTYEGESIDESGGDENEELTRFAVTFKTENIAGVTATVVRETNWAGGFLQEDTDDWFAQDTSGNVWYLGESTTAFEYDDKGNFIGTNNEGAWRAGVNGAFPGYIMPANPQINDNFYQEFAPNDAAVDQAKVVSRTATLDTELGISRNVLQTLEFAEIAPGVFDYKYYAPGMGLVQVEELGENLEPKFVEELESVTTMTQDAFNFKSGVGTAANDVIDGDNQANKLEGRRGDDFLQGQEGNDALLGQDGKDFLMGGDGKDTLIGGKGEDILVGGREFDDLKGGSGRDQFVFRALQDGGDSIQDFNRQDVIVLAEIFGLESYNSLNPFEDYLQIQTVGSDTVVQIDPDGGLGNNPFVTLVTLKNTNVNGLRSENFVF